MLAACRMCLVEVAGTKKLLPACITNVAEGMEVKTDTEKLRKYRLMILELLFCGAKPCLLGVRFQRPL